MRLNDESLARRRVWSPQEDRILQELMDETYGNVSKSISLTKAGSSKPYTVIASLFNHKIAQVGLPPRAAKRIRERWVDHLNPYALKNWQDSEHEAHLLEFAVQLGHSSGKWSQVQEEGGRLLKAGGFQGYYSSTFLRNAIYPHLKSYKSTNQLGEKRRSEVASEENTVKRQHFSQDNQDDWADTVALLERCFDEERLHQP